MDVSGTVAPNSEQINAEDLLGGPRTVTITAVEKGTPDQPVFIHLAEFPDRTYRPAKSMRRVLLAAWGSDSTAYVGRRLVIFNDPHVKWGGQEVGGVRISHLSHIDKPFTVALTVTRGRRAPFTVEPLTTDRTQAALDAIHAATTVDQLDKITAHATKVGIDVADAINTRRTQLEDAS